MRPDQSVWARYEMSDSDSASSASWTSPGAGITGGYNGDSETLRIFIVFFAGLAMYNSVELTIMIFLTFRRYRGLYFWSLLISAIGIVPYSLGFLLKFMNLATGESRWAAIVLLTIGWYPMITGESLVLWSRLHLIVSGAKGDKIIKYTKWMIILCSVFLFIPTTVLTFGSNSDTADLAVFKRGYNIMEKIQMCGFFCQEVVLSSIYIFETVRILRTSLQPNTRKTMKQLVLINAVIIIMDLGLLGLEAASLYILETLLKGVIYSIKLKLEFAILGKLVKFVGGHQEEGRLRKDSIGFVTGPWRARKGSSSSDDMRVMNISDFVDLTRISTDHTYPSRASVSVPSKRRSAQVAAGGGDWEFDFARFQHVEDVTKLDEAALAPGPNTQTNGDV